jgi:hypothetical protein
MLAQMIHPGGDSNIKSQSQAISQTNQLRIQDLLGVVQKGR